jgi:hypothetical protein
MKIKLGRKGESGGNSAMSTETPVPPREIVHGGHTANLYSVGLSIVMYFRSRCTILKIYILLSTKYNLFQNSYYKIQDS